MELKVQVLLVIAAVVAWTQLFAWEPVSALGPSDGTSDALATMEDHCAIHRDDEIGLKRLADRYLVLGKPGLAVAVLRTAPRHVLDDPEMTHRLARAYEASGRLLDAYATADLALARCLRAIGTSDAPAGTPTPSFSCSERTQVALDVHRSALARMIAWGVADPSTDARTALAYRIATRSARLDVASAE